ADGVVRSRDASVSVSYGDLIGDRTFNLKVDPKALLKAPDHFRFIGKSLRRPDIPTKVTGLHRYLHDLILPGMLHARVVRPPALPRTLTAEYRWPIQTHGSIGPSCGVADVQADRATIWSSSQNTHGFQATAARFLGLERHRVRVVYMDGAGSYGPNGADDACAEAALISKALGKPVRVQ